MKKIFIILFAMVTTGGLVYAGLCNMGGSGNGLNSGQGLNSGTGTHIGEGMGMGQGKGQGYGKNMTTEESGQRFQHMLGMKGEKMELLAQNLEEIIELAEKVGYDTSKLKEYQSELESLKAEYEDLDGDVEKMCNNKNKWRGANGNMRELMQKISKEFQNIKSE